MASISTNDLADPANQRQIRIWEIEEQIRALENDKRNIKVNGVKLLGMYPNRVRQTVGRFKRRIAELQAERDALANHE